MQLWRGKRLVVMHHAHLLSGKAIQLLLPGDLLFLDDCLFSQLVWLLGCHAGLRAMGIDMVLGLSTALVRQPGTLPEIETSDKLHARWHAGDETSLAGFMSEAEIREALSLDGVYLACHGHLHLRLEDYPAGLAQTVAFRRDLAEAKAKLAGMRLETDVFVYPYAFWQFPLAEAAVREAGFKIAFAGQKTQRVSIEEIAACQT